jgi:hypothetical protein
MDGERCTDILPAGYETGLLQQFPQSALHDVLVRPVQMP